ncbi:MAG: hypothetical protein JJD96_08510, partial [Thermoleophilia bacterium]|nr:hypothetical protein [Thermoleophilia bacterium]
MAMEPNQVRETAHSLPSQEVLSLLDSDLARGLSREEAVSRLGRFGPNQLPDEPRINPLKLLLDQFRSVLIIVLLAAATLNLVIWLLDREEGLPYDTLVIMAIVLANAALGFFQEYKAERSLEKLKELSGPEAALVRGGYRQRTPASRLVPGDIIVLAAGDRITADARLCEAS